MKKLIIALLIASLAICGITACTSESDNKGTDTVTTTAATTPKATTTTSNTVTPEPEPGGLVFTIDVDITLEDGNAGIVFQGQDTNNFMMWQLAIGEYNDGNLYFRPHSWESGAGRCIDNIVINEIAGLEDINTDYGETYHMTVKIADNGVVTTLINGVVIETTDSYSYLLDYESIGLIGFRCDAYNNGTIPEVGVFDNFIIKDGEGNTILDETFDSAENMFCASIIASYPSNAEVVDGALKVTGKVLYMTEIN